MKAYGGLRRIFLNKRVMHPLGAKNIIKAKNLRNQPSECDTISTFSTVSGIADGSFIRGDKR